MSKLPGRSSDGDVADRFLVSTARKRSLEYDIGLEREIRVARETRDRDLTNMKNWVA